VFATRLDASVRPGAAIACAPSLGGCRRLPVSSYDFLGQRLHRPATCLRAPACHTLVACPALSRHPWQQASPPTARCPPPTCSLSDIPSRMVPHQRRLSSSCASPPRRHLPSDRPSAPSVSSTPSSPPPIPTRTRFILDSRPRRSAQVFGSSLSTSYGRRHRRSPKWMDSSHEWLLAFTCVGTARTVVGGVLSSLIGCVIWLTAFWSAALRSPPLVMIACSVPYAMGLFVVSGDAARMRCDACHYFC